MSVVWEELRAQWLQLGAQPKSWERYMARTGDTRGDGGSPNPSSASSMRLILVGVRQLSGNLYTSLLQYMPANPTLTRLPSGIQSIVPSSAFVNATGRRLMSCTVQLGRLIREFVSFMWRRIYSSVPNMRRYLTTQYSLLLMRITTWMISHTGSVLASPYCSIRSFPTS
uniref:Uncharacterized protein n=1 Tax=Riboviria sp. TaxID=2585031 RepID=A0A8K1U2P8_9VIRU|nr:MAG: hypothetical protein 1 [Riboviria sp.]